MSFRHWRTALRPVSIGSAVVAGAFTLSADAGVYVLTGSTATVAVQRKVDATAGVYAETGSVASFGIGMPAATGSYAVTGAAATPAVARKLSSVDGVYAVSGSIGSFAIGMPATAGVYGITGSAATLQSARKLSSTAGVYLVSGADATLTKSSAGFTLAADAGVYATTGSAITFKAARALTSAAGLYTVTGSNATLTVPGGAVTGSGELDLFGLGTSGGGRVAHFGGVSGRGASIFERTRPRLRDVETIEDAPALEIDHTFAMAGTGSVIAPIAGTGAMPARRIFTRGLGTVDRTPIIEEEAFLLGLLLGDDA